MTSSILNDSTDEMKLVCSFAHEKWTQGRTINSIDWYGQDLFKIYRSPRFPELILAAYGKNSLNVNDSDGLILVWNRYMPNRPEFILFSQVLSRLLT